MLKAYEEAGGEHMEEIAATLTRTFILGLTPDEFMYAAQDMAKLLWEDGVTDNSIRDVTLLEREAFKFMVKAMSQNLDRMIEIRMEDEFVTRTRLSERLFPTAPMAPPPPSSLTKALMRKAPAYKEFDGSTRKKKYDFAESVKRMLLEALLVDEAREMLGALMGTQGRRFMSSKACVTARTGVQLLGALLLEVEGVADEGELRSVIFFAQREVGEDYLVFLDRTDQRHSIYCEGYPSSPPDHTMMLNRCRAALRGSELMLKMVMDNCRTVMDAREAVARMAIRDENGMMRVEGNGSMDKQCRVLNFDPEPEGASAILALQTQLTELTTKSSPILALQQQVAELLKFKGRSLKEITCFGCSEKGHKIADCPNMQAFHEYRRQAAVAAPTGHATATGATAAAEEGNPANGPDFQ